MREHGTMISPGRGFPAHADHDELLSWYRRIGGRKHTVLLHGQEEVMQHFVQLLDDTEVLMPAIGSELTL